MKNLLICFMACTMPLMTTTSFAGGPDCPANAESSMGINIAHIAYWEREWTLVDQMKAAGGWYTQNDSTWDTLEQDQLDLDEHGYPRSLPAADDGSVSYRYVGALMLNGSEGFYPTGQYTVLYQGEGTIQYFFDAIKNEELSTPGRDVIELDNNPTGGGILLRITETDPNGTGNYLRDIHVISPGGICNNDPFTWCEDPATCPVGNCTPLADIHDTQIFHPVYLNDLKKYKTVRFMDFLETNFNPMSSWDERKTIDDYSWMSDTGAPYEIAAELSNKLSADAWITVPVRADDHFVTQAATVMLDRLDPNLKVYIEYSNEIWNTGFSQGNWVQEQAQLDWPDDPTDGYIKRLHWYGKRTAEIGSIFKSVFGPQADRVVVVMGGTTANPWATEQSLDCHVWQTENGGIPCDQYVDAIAIAPYFGGYVGAPQFESNVNTWLTDPDGGLEMLVEELTMGGHLHDPNHFPEWERAPEFGAFPVTRERTAAHADISEARNLQLISYEGGQHLVGVGPAFNNEAMRSLFITMNRDPRMYDYYTGYLEGWRDNGGTLFCQFLSVGEYGPFGSWGSKEYQQQDDAPKYNAIMDFIDANPCWWEGCGYPPTLSASPTDTQACLSADVEFNVSVTGTNLSFQWRKDGVDIPGAETGSLSLSGITMTDAAAYDCVITNLSGVVTSAPAVLSVLEPVAVTASPANAQRCLGQTVTFTVTATGSDLTYQWRKDGVAIPGANAATYEISPVSAADFGAYDCVVTNNCGAQTTDAATLTVSSDELSITDHPNSGNHCTGEAHTLSITGTGDALTYQWTKDGVDIPGATTTSLNFASLALSDEGDYTCIITNECGSETSQIAHLAVGDPVSLTGHPSGAELCSGPAHALTVTATGSNLTYQWRKDGVDIPGATTASLDFAAIAASDSGSYTCVVANGCQSQTSDAADLVVRDPIAVTTAPTDIDACAGDNINITVVATGTDVTYQWRKDGVDVPGGTAATLSFSDLNIGDGGVYTCQLTNACGSVTTDPITLDVPNFATVTSQPTGDNLCQGESVVLSVTATGGDLTYQWSRDGFNIAGATSPTLSLNNITTAQSGLYRCFVSNRCSSTLSQTANMIVRLPVSVITQPSGFTGCAGDTVNLSVLSLGSSRTFQWRKDGVDLPGQNANTLTLAGATSADSGAYTCVIANSCNSITTTAASVLIEDPAALVGQPSGATVCEGDTVSLSVNATGTHLNYQWRRNDADISGATTATFTIPSVTGNDAASYYCRVWNDCATVFSNTIAVTLNDPISIDSQPNAQTVCIGQDATFEIDVTGSGITYQWRRNGVNLPGATNASLTVNNPDGMNAGSYDCLVTNSCATVTSNSADLLISEPLAIDSQPVGDVLCQGDAFSMSVSTSGTAQSYQWAKDGEDIPGATSATLNFDAVLPVDAGSYTCRVTNPCNSATSDAAVLAINPGPGISHQPEPADLCTGEPLTLTVASDGSDLTYQWRRDSANIVGANAATYTVPAVSESDAGIYDCIISSACGVSLTHLVPINVSRTTQITLNPTDQSICLGGDTAFTVVASGTNLTYSWRKNGNPIPGATGATLTINNVANSDSAGYQCQVTGDCGTIFSGTAVLSIATGVQIVSEPANLSVCEGQSASFLVSAAGSGLTYQWHKDGVDIAGATNPTYFIPVVNSTHLGTYSCRVTSACGSSTSRNAQLSLAGDIAITSQPQDTLGCTGNSATLSVAASGTALSYQWRKNGVNINGAVNAQLIFSALTTANAGSYDCIVTNPCGSNTSAAAQLTVTNAVIITVQPTGGFYCVGQQTTLGVQSAGINRQFQWQKDGVDLPGETTNLLTLRNLDLSDSGDYTCLINNSCSQITSDAAAVVVATQPSISQQPENTVKCTGQALELSVNADGGNLNYAWSRNGENLPDQTQATLHIDNVSADDAGSYTCLVTNHCGNVTSSAATVSILASELGISTHPVDTVSCSGERVMLGLVAFGDGLSYQWRKDGQNIPGATNGSYIIDPVAASHSGAYDCVVINLCGSETSRAAQLTVPSTPVFTSQPQDTTACLGSDLALTVAAQGDNLSYQWYLNNQSIAGAVNATLNLTDLSLGDAGSWRCDVSNGCETLSSNAATLTVDQIPTVIQDPLNANACLGGSHTFSVQAENVTAYQWRFQGIPIPGAQGVNLTISDISEQDVGSYDCELTNGCGSGTTLTANLALIESDVALTGQPQNAAACFGETVTFAVTATGTDLAFQWRHNGVDLAGANAPTLTLTDVAEADFGNYGCVVSDTCIDLESQIAQLTLSDGIAVTGHPADATVCPGGAFTLALTFEGSAETFQWRKNGIDIPGATAATYSVLKAQATDNGAYTCVISGSCGSITSNAAQVDVLPPLDVIVNYTQVAQGIAPISLLADTTCGVPEIDVIWLQDGQTVQTGPNLIVDPPPAQTTSYTVRATDAAANLAETIVTILVSPAGVDPNNDGVNDLDDLHFVAEYWGSSNPDVEADGDQSITILDLIFVNIGNTDTEPAQGDVATRTGRNRSRLGSPQQP